MIDSLKYEIKKILSKDTKYVSDRVIELNLFYLFNLKLLCDKHDYKYEDIVSLDSKLEVNEYPIISLGNIKINSLLSIIRYDSLEVLVKEFLSTYVKEPTFIPDNEKVICLMSKYNYSLYDETGNTTYVIDRLISYQYGINVFKLFDEILNINNKYEEYNNINFDEYNYVYINDFAPKYLFIKEREDNVYKMIFFMLRRHLHINVILHTDFKKVSNMNEFKSLVEYLDKVIFYDDIKTYLLFKNKEDKSVSIINNNKDKVIDISRLNEIIVNDRRIKDVLTKATTDEIANNCYRLGFRLYQDKIKDNKININEIVDENTRLIKELASLNREIEEEINKLMNK